MLKVVQFWTILFALSLPSVAQVQAWQNWCQNGGQTVVTQGLNSVTHIQRSFPKCTVTVFITGTQNPASIFSDTLSTPLSNPFTANVDGSFKFYASTSNCYDITISGGNTGDSLPAPFTFVDQCLGSGGGGSGGPATQLFKAVPNCTAAGTVLNETVQESSQVVNGVTITCATVGQVGSTSIIGVCSNAQGGTCGNTGIALVLTSGTGPCTMDGQGVQGDYIIQSPTINGFCSDFGSTKPTTVTETLGNVSVPNSGGAGNAATVQVAPLSLLLPGASGSSNVNACSQVGAVAYYSGLNIISCDLAFITDGHGHVQAVSLGLTGSGAGFMYCVQGPAPSLSVSNSVYTTCPTSVSSTYGNAWPGTQGATNNCLGISSQASTLNSLGWLTCNGVTPYTIQVNGASLTAGDTVNFNNTTPAAGSNGINVTFQTSKASTTDSVSAELVGDGNSGHVLTGTGSFANIPRNITMKIRCSSGLVAQTTDGACSVIYQNYKTAGCTIGGYTLLIDQGTITIKLWKVASGTAIPTVSNVISTSGWSISSGTQLISTNVSDLTTTSVATNDTLALDVTAVSAATYVELTLLCQ